MAQPGGILFGHDDRHAHFLGAGLEGAGVADGPGRGLHGGHETLLHVDDDQRAVGGANEHDLSPRIVKSRMVI
jgi:hypothetical protein